MVVKVGEGERGSKRAGFQRIWIELSSGNNCMSSSCHGKPRQLCWRPPRLTANKLPSQAQEVMSGGRTPGLPELSAGWRKGVARCRNGAHWSDIKSPNKQKYNNTKSTETVELYYMSKLIISEENYLSVEKYTDCFVFGGLKNSLRRILFL